MNWIYQSRLILALGGDNDEVAASMMLWFWSQKTDLMAIDNQVGIQQRMPRNITRSLEQVQIHCLLHVSVMLRFFCVGI